MTKSEAEKNANIQPSKFWNWLTYIPGDKELQLIPESEETESKFWKAFKRWLTYEPGDER